MHDRNDIIINLFIFFTISLHHVKMRLLDVGKNNTVFANSPYYGIGCPDLQPSVRTARDLHIVLLAMRETLGPGSQADTPPGSQMTLSGR